MMWMVVTVVRNKHHFISLLRPAVRQPQQRLESIRENEHRNRNKMITQGDFSSAGGDIKSNVGEDDNNVGNM